jgi:hypothetical protein
MLAWFQVHEFPLHPMSAFIHWQSESKKRLKQESREAGIKFSKHAAAEWAKIDDKSKWEDLAAADKEDYACEKEEMVKEKVGFCVCHSDVK